jgi:hypothetical protein
MRPSNSAVICKLGVSLDNITYAPSLAMSLCALA